jgi:hypothetical protein
MDLEMDRPLERIGGSNPELQRVWFLLLPRVLNRVVLDPPPCPRKGGGEVKEEIVARELIAEVKRPLRNFSTAGGLRHMLHFPFSIVRATVERAKKKHFRRNQQ